MINFNSMIHVLYNPFHCPFVIWSIPTAWCIVCDRFESSSIDRKRQDAQSKGSLSEWWYFKTCSIKRHRQKTHSKCKRTHHTHIPKRWPSSSRPLKRTLTVRRSFTSCSHVAQTDISLSCSVRNKGRDDTLHVGKCPAAHSFMTYHHPDETHETSGG